MFSKGYECDFHVKQMMSLLKKLLSILLEISEKGISLKRIPTEMGKEIPREGLLNSSLHGLSQKLEQGVISLDT